jgi:hypothetical protein
VAFVSDLPNMSKEVALKVVEQFPDFKSLVLGSLDELHNQATQAVRVNWRSQKKVHKAFAHYREVLSRELGRENLSGEERFAILELFRKAIADESRKDSEHKIFVLRALGVVGAVAAVVVVSAAGVLGAKGKVNI